MLQGTKNMSQTELENQLSNIGARFTSYVTRDNSAYFIECASNDVEQGLHFALFIQK